MIPQKKLDHWVKNELNVLFTGEHGVGKTSIVIDTWERHGLTYVYFSAPTLDPWVDLVGVPKEATDPETGLPFLSLLRPKLFALDRVQAVFFDEFNRAPKKVKNAVMELMQFKSINGMKFHNLKMVWGAVNPEDEDETYQVEPIDPAQLDRFHVHIKIPFKPDKAWFTKRYGKQVADSAIEWWDGVPEKMKPLVSPRRLQYVLDHWKTGGDLSDMIPAKVGVQKLEDALRTAPIMDQLRNLKETNDTVRGEEFLANENNYTAAIRYIVEKADMMSFFLPLCSEEKLSSLVNTTGSAAQTFVISNYEKHAKFNNVLYEIIKAKTNKQILNKIPQSAQHRILQNGLLQSAKTIDTPWMAIINRIDGLIDGSSTSERENFLCEMDTNLPRGSMIYEEAQATWDVLEKIAGKTQSEQFAKYAQYVLPIFDECVYATHRQTKENFDTIMQNLRTRCGKLLQRMHWKALIPQLQSKKDL